MEDFFPSEPNQAWDWQDVVLDRGEYDFLRSDPSHVLILSCFHVLRLSTAQLESLPTQTFSSGANDAFQFRTFHLLNDDIRASREPPSGPIRVLHPPSHQPTPSWFTPDVAAVLQLDRRQWYRQYRWDQSLALLSSCYALHPRHRLFEMRIRKVTARDHQTLCFHLSLHATRTEFIGLHNPLAWDYTGEGVKVDRVYVSSLGDCAERTGGPTEWHIFYEDGLWITFAQSFKVLDNVTYRCWSRGYDRLLDYLFEENPAVKQVREAALPELLNAIARFLKIIRVTIHVYLMLERIRVDVEETMDSSQQQARCRARLALFEEELLHETWKDPRKVATREQLSLHCFAHEDT
jgi:hypothetical protein